MGRRWVAFLGGAGAVSSLAADSLVIPAGAGTNALQFSSITSFANRHKWEWRPPNQGHPGQ